jgi:CheY-like chemotaxis protein
LSVRDTGRGISPENLERIFEPYFTTKEKGEGTGLGLAVVHGIVKDQGGEISVYSEEGRGTVFRIYLPAIEKRLHREAKTADAVPHGRGEKILFLDDEPMVAELNKEILKEIGYTVTALTDPVQAVELFRKKRGAFDLVITDKTMPHMTGFDVVREIRNIRADIPVIVCSGFQEKGDLDKIAALGVSRMIIKPAAMHVMANAIRNVLDQKDKS